MRQKFYNIANFQTPDFLKTLQVCTLSAYPNDFGQEPRPVSTQALCDAALPRFAVKLSD
jgi:hypothetical protein